MGLPLWLVKREHDAVGYDEQAGVVVAARSARVARQVAHKTAGCEVVDEFGKDQDVLLSELWLRKATSQCIKIADDSIYDRPTTVLRDFQAG